MIISEQQIMAFSVNPAYYLSLTPQERKEFRHMENKINFPERHKPIKDIIYFGDDICYRCVKEWSHQYFFDFREDCYKRKTNQKN